MARFATSVAVVLAVFEWCAVWFRWWPTWSTMIERLPKDVGPVLLGAFFGAFTWWAYRHFDWDRTKP